MRNDQIGSDMRATKLNLGSGKLHLAGYENIDIADGRSAYPLSDFADGSVDEVRASHVLEHFPYPETLAVVREWVRVLKPGGVLKIAVPDLDVIIDHYVSAPAEPTEAYIMGGRVDANDVHGAVFNRAKLETILRAAGCNRIEPWASDAPDCSALPVSLNIQARKVTPRQKAPQIYFVLSAPRFGLTSTWMPIAQTLAQVPNATITTATGAYWGQCMERVMQQAVDGGAEYIVTLDYDSVFTPRDAMEMIYLMESFPESDAIAPMQQARGWDSPLMGIIGEDGKAVRDVDAQTWLKHPVVKVSTAHFGLTIFRASALSKFPHPWFYGKPNDAGLWEDGKVDDDIQFWKSWSARGMSLYVAPRVVIGHIVEAIAWPDGKMRSALQYAGDYHKHGKPAGAWK